MAQRIRKKDRMLLLKSAESGVGYQLVAEGDVLILNATIALNLIDRSTLSPQDLNWLLEAYMPLHYNNTEQDLNARMRSEDRAIADLEAYNGSLEIQMHGSYASTAKPNELFYRYSAFWPDRRIAHDGSVSIGTYATTQNDTPIVPSGLAAVGRYALPNPAPALYQYEIGPVHGEPIWCGTCAPRFGQAGGGVEVKFGQALGAGSANATPTLISDR